MGGDLFSRRRISGGTDRGADGRFCAEPDGCAGDLAGT